MVAATSSELGSASLVVGSSSSAPVSSVVPTPAPNFAVAALPAPLSALGDPRFGGGCVARYFSPLVFSVMGGDVVTGGGTVGGAG